MRAVIYIRVSTEEQLEGHSLDAQRTTTRALLTDRQWDFAGEYLDAGISAKSDSYRPALAQLLEDAGQGALRRGGGGQDRPLLPPPQGAADGPGHPAGVQRHLRLRAGEDRPLDPVGQADDDRVGHAGRDLHRQPALRDPQGQDGACPEGVVERQHPPGLLRRALLGLHRRQRRELLPAVRRGRPRGRPQAGDPPGGRRGGPPHVRLVRHRRIHRWRDRRAAERRRPGPAGRPAHRIPQQRASAPGAADGLQQGYRQGAPAARVLQRGGRLLRSGREGPEAEAQEPAGGLSRRTSGAGQRRRLRPGAGVAQDVRSPGALGPHAIRACIRCPA